MTTSSRSQTRRPAVVAAHRFTVAVAATALATVLAACGSVGSSGSSSTASPTGKGPAKIQIAGGAGAGSRSAVAAAPAAADAKIAGGPMGMPYRPVTYEVRGTLPTLDGDAQAWSYPAGGASVTAADVAKLARALGLDGSVTPVPTEEGGGFRVGPNDGSGPTLNVSADALGSWWYSAQTTSAVACAGVATVGGDGADTTTALDTASDPAAYRGCVAPPPEGVPSADEANAAAARLAKAIGANVDAADIEVSGDGYGRYAAMYERLDGVRSPLAISASWGAKGLVQYANGNLAKPVKADRYPRLGTQAALDALKAGDTGWFGGPVALAAGTSGGAATEIVAGQASTAVVATATAPPPTAVAPRVEPGQPDPGACLVPDPATIAAPGVATRAVEPPCTFSPDSPPTSIPEETIDVTVEPVTVQPPVVDTTPIVTTITDVREAFVQVYGVDGEVWLLPGYDFVTNDNGSIVVPAVDKSYVEVVQPTANGEPGAKGLPVPETGTVVTPASAPAPTPLPAPAPAGTVVCIKAPCP